MTDRPEGVGGADEEPGPPIAELADLREEPSPRFINGVMDGINRRQTGTQFAELSWWGMTGFLMEFVRVLYRCIRPGDDTEGGA